MNYLEEIAAQIRSEIPVEKLPDENVDELMMAYALLAEAKGTSVTDEDVHDAWSAWMTKIDPRHEALVPYDQLDAETKTEDTVFTAAIRRTVRKQQKS